MLWKSPTDLAGFDLLNGSGGKEHQPVGPFTFLKEDADGTNPKFDVQDSQGTKWKVKLGEETGPETAASRFVWATGYFTYDNYFLPKITVESLPAKLKRGQKLRLEGNSFADVRLKRSAKSEKKAGIWKWKENPFLDTRELNGLRTLMAVMNNWDLKDVNNAIWTGEDGTETYLVSDLGATFGTDHLVKAHDVAKGNLGSYQKSTFIKKKDGQFVDFGTPGRPSAAFTFAPKENFSRMAMESIGQHIPVADAKWLGELLGQLTPAQIRDAFRAAGYKADDVEGFSKVMEGRIAELKGL